MNYVFDPEAEAEFNEAVSFYEDREPHLGEDFAHEVFSTISAILSNPFSWPRLEDEVRRCLVHRFPYGVLYCIERDRVLILAVMHLHRYPDYWKHRQ